MHFIWSCIFIKAGRLGFKVGGLATLIKTKKLLINQGCGISIEWCLVVFDSCYYFFAHVSPMGNRSQIFFCTSELLKIPPFDALYVVCDGVNSINCAAPEFLVYSAHFFPVQKTNCNCRQKKTCPIWRSFLHTKKQLYSLHFKLCRLIQKRWIFLRQIRDVSKHRACNYSRWQF